MAQPASTQLMLYMSAQNELAGKARENIDAIKSCVNLNGICAYIMVDTVADSTTARPGKSETFKYLLPPGASENEFVPVSFALRNKIVTSPDVFNLVLNEANSHFQTFSDNHNPQQKILIFWGHGGGMVMLDEQQQKGIDRARANMKDFANVLVGMSKAKKQRAFDIIAFDSCYMCMIETMHELREVSPLALCSSTMVDADGFPYESMVGLLKEEGRALGPKVAAERMAQIYNQHYLDVFPDGNRFLFVCDLEQTAACVAALNALGKALTSLLGVIDGDDPVRDAIREALIGAGADSSYVYVLQFLKMLALTLDGRISNANLDVIKQHSGSLRKSIHGAFKGNLGDSTDVPVSPLIWAPMQINSFRMNAANYCDLDSSEKGQGGWITLWWTFHGQSAEAVWTPSGNTLGLPVTSQLTV